MLYNNSGNGGPIFKILSPLLISENILYVYTTNVSTSPAICCYITSWNSKIQKMLPDFNVERDN